VERIRFSPLDPIPNSDIYVLKKLFPSFTLIFTSPSHISFWKEILTGRKRERMRGREKWKQRKKLSVPLTCFFLPFCSYFVLNRKKGRKKGRKERKMQIKIQGLQINYSLPHGERMNFNLRGKERQFIFLANYHSKQSKPGKWIKPIPLGDTRKLLQISQNAESFPISH